MNDPIADMLTRIRNANIVGKRNVVIPHSKLKQLVADVLLHEGFISDVKVSEKKNKIGKEMQLKLIPKRISHIKRVSKPGARIYVNKETIPTVLNNVGIAILSTSKGLMTNKQAKVQGVGGEVLCEVY